jgi:short-subunit dehydrogenase
MGRTALVTGASGGIGAELARSMAADGWNLVLVARGEENLRELADELERAHDTKSVVLAADLEQPAARERLAAELRSRGVEVEALVNNAGFGALAPFVEMPLETALAMLAVNVTALTQLTRLFLPAMVARRRGYILNVASTAAFQPGPWMAVYYASKAYVLSFSEAIAHELRKTGVRVTALCPGATATGFASTAGSARSRLFQLARPMSAPEVARFGYRAMLRGKRVAIPGLRNKILAQGVRISPRRLATAIAGAMQDIV